MNETPSKENWFVKIILSLVGILAPLPPILKIVGVIAVLLVTLGFGIIINDINQTQGLLLGFIIFCVVMLVILAMYFWVMTYRKTEFESMKN